MFSLRQLPGRRRSWLLLLFAALALVLPLRLLGITTHAELWFSVTFALCLFILPGAVLITALQGRLPVCIPHFISYGFATSLVMISIIGLLARSLHWTIDGIKALWLGLLLGAVLHLARRARGRRIIGAKPSTEAVFLVLCMLMATSMLAFSGMHHQPRNGDQHEYHAQVNRFEGGGPLDWQEIFYDTGGSPSPRFHLTYWTLAQSLVTSFSAQHILNADFVINSLLMIVALCAAFTFARNMGASSRNACLVAMLQLLCYAFLLGGIRQPGGQFYSRLLEDKLVAGFVVAPLAISAAQRAFRQRTRGALFDFALTFAATLFAHVLIAGFVLAVIVLGFAPRILLATGGKRRRSLAILILALALFSPAVVLRQEVVEASSMFDVDVTPGIPTQDLFVSYTMNPILSDTPLYAIHPKAVGTLTYALLALVLLAAVLQRGDERRWLMAALALTAGMGVMLETAWILGLLVGSKYIMRVLWILPYGYLVYFLADYAWSRLRARVPLPHERLRTVVVAAVAAVTIMALAYFLSGQRGVDFSRSVAPVIDSRRDWIELADFLAEHHDERVVVLSSPDLRNQVLSSSALVMELSRYHAKRMMSGSGLSQSEAQERIDDHFGFWSDDYALLDKVAVLDRHGVDYLLYSSAYDEVMQPIYAVDGLLVERLFAWEMFRLSRVG